MNITIAKFLCQNKAAIKARIARNYGEAVQLIKNGFVRINGETLTCSSMQLGFGPDEIRYVWPNDEIEVNKNGQTIILTGSTVVFTSPEEVPYLPYNSW